MYDIHLRSNITVLTLFINSITNQEEISILKITKSAAWGVISEGANSREIKERFEFLEKLLWCSGGSMLLIKVAIAHPLILLDIIGFFTSCGAKLQAC